MSSIPWLIISILVVLIILAIVAVMLKRKRNVQTDYYMWFIIGIIWIAIGIPLKNYALSIIGIVFAVLGLKNKDKWKANRQTFVQMDGPKKKRMIIMSLVLGIFVLAALFFLFILKKGLL